MIAELYPGGISLPAGCRPKKMVRISSLTQSSSVLGKPEETVILQSILERRTTLENPLQRSKGKVLLGG